MSSPETWLLSSNDVDWSDSEEFPTREDAIAAAPEFADEMDADAVHVGLQVAVAFDEIVHASRVVEDVEEALHGEFLGTDLDIELHVTDDQKAELQRLIVGWFESSGIKIPVWRVERVEQIDIAARAGQEDGQ